MTFGPIFHDFLYCDWETARGYLAEELAHLQGTLAQQLGGFSTTAVEGSIVVGNVNNQWDTLTAGPANTVLRSNGTSPVWGKVVLTTDVQGTLPVTRGGTGISTTFTNGSLVFAGASGIYSQDNANLFWDDTNNWLGINTAVPTAALSVAEKFLVTSAGLCTKYNNMATVAWGVPSIYGQGRLLGQTTAVGSVATYTVGATDGSFLVSSGLNVTAYTSGTVTVACDYTDETNTARTFIFTFSGLTGTLTTAIGAVGPYEGLPAHIRCKASTAITIKTTIAALTGTYNIEGYITQIG